MQSSGKISEILVETVGVFYKKLVHSFINFAKKISEENIPQTI